MSGYLATTITVYCEIEMGEYGDIIEDVTANIRHQLKYVGDVRFLDPVATRGIPAERADELDQRYAQDPS